MPALTPKPVRQPPRQTIRRARQWGLIGGLGALAMLAGLAAVVIGGLDGRRSAARTGKPHRGSADRSTDRRTDGTPAAVPVAGPPPAPAPDLPADPPVRPARQVVVDDPTLPWASPTSGPPPRLAYLPPGSQLILLARLAELSADDEGRLFLGSLGPAAAEAIATLEKLCGRRIVDIESVQAGWQAGGPDEVVAGYAVRFIEGRAAPADEASRQAAWGETTEVAIDGETVYRSPTRSFWVPAAEKGRVLVIAPHVMVARDVSLGPGGPPRTGQEPLMAAIVRESLATNPATGTGLAATLPGDLEALVGMLDADRHLTVFGSPHFLLNAGRPLLAGSLARVLEPLEGLFGESVQAAAVSLHVGDNAYLEMDVVSSLELPARKRVPGLVTRFDGLPAQVERFCASLDPDPYGRVLVLRLPAMLRALSGQVRAGAEGRGVVLNAYLPRHAPHNLALAAEIALAQGPATSADAAPPAALSGAMGVVGRLTKKMTLAFASDNLEHSIQMVSEETGVPMEILGGDLQLEGITKNQSFGLDEQDKTADSILRAILAKSNPEGKLVYVVGEKDGEEWVFITTRAAAAKRGDTPPPTAAP